MISTRSPAVWHVQELIFRHTGLLRGSKGPPYFWACSHIGTQGQVSKTHPEKRASYKEIRGIDMIIFSVIPGWAYDKPFGCFRCCVDIFSSYSIKIHKSIIMGMHVLIPQIYTEYVQYSWCCAICWVTKTTKLNSCPGGALSSGQNRHENRDLLTEKGANSYENIER